MYQVYLLLSSGRALKCWDDASVHVNLGFSNGAEVDLNIDGDFKEEDLVKFLRSYSEQKEIGRSVLTSNP